MISLGAFVSPMFLALVKNLHFPQTSELTDLLESGLSDVINQLQLTETLLLDSGIRVAHFLSE